MLKNEFLTQLRSGLNGLPQEDIEERLVFYTEMIEDRMEEGLSEEAAVAAAGPVQQIVEQVIEDIPFAKIAKERVKRRGGLKTWEIVLLAVGSPVWLALGIAAFAVILALYISLWAVIVSLWSVFASLAACAVGGFVAGIVFIGAGNVPAGLATIAAALVAAGLAIFAFYGCKAATKGTAWLTRKMAVWIKNCFIRKEEA